MSRGFYRQTISLFAVFGALVAAAPAQAYDITAILPLTGGASFLGKEEQQAMQLIEPLLNKSGGIAGQQVHFQYLDDQSNPQTGVQLANTAIAAKPEGTSTVPAAPERSLQASVSASVVGVEWVP